MRTLNVTSVSEAKTNIADFAFKGNPDTWRLICKAWSYVEGWMRSTKAMEIPGTGCLVNVSSVVDSDYDDDGKPVGQQVVSESVTFVPGVKLIDSGDGTFEFVPL
jgi:hypothetical protein